MKISRRTFLTGIGGVAVGAASLKGISHTMAQSGQLVEDWTNHTEDWKVSVCPQCAGGCGLLARVVDGKVVRVHGHPLHPVNLGGLGPKGVVLTETLHNPDRLTTPLRRKGARGAGQWEAVSWEEALGQITGHLAALRKAGKAHTAVWLEGRVQGLQDGLFRRFMAACGSANTIRMGRTPDLSPPGQYYTQGITQPLAFDLARSRFVLSFGYNLLEGEDSPVFQQRQYGEMRQGEGNSATLVQVESRLSVTGAKADRWIPILPGTQAALALGLAHVILREGLHDKAFVSSRTTGFEPFKKMVLAEYTPQKVQVLTGVSVRSIEHLAREFVGTHQPGERPAVALIQTGQSDHPREVYTQMAVHSLNALAGSLGKTGGGVAQQVLPAWPQGPGSGTNPPVPAKPRADQSPDGVTLGGVAHLGENILKGSPYPLGALFLYQANPVYGLPDGTDWKAALEAPDKIGLVVSFSSFMDETSLLADLILPDSSPLERWQHHQTTHLAGVRAVSITPPVIPPLHNTRQTEDVVLHLAHELGLQGSLPFKDYSALMEAHARTLHQNGGRVISPQGGKQSDGFSDFWKELQTGGVWEAKPAAGSLFGNGSGKFEFVSQTLKKELSQRGGSGGVERAAKAMGIQAKGDALLMAHFEPTVFSGEAGDFPLMMNPYKLLAHSGSRTANSPTLQQFQAVHLGAKWDSWVEINPETARKASIQDGDEVWVVSAKGRLRLTARLYAGAMPEVVNIPLGQGHTAGGRWAAREDGTIRGGNPFEIMMKTYDPMRGLPATGTTRVRLEKA
ncbi:MAG: molybdopterin-dependent oxidoreductase [Deltaproteobacteria bacterium]|nr:molybdopterin-dependent oxidoreductase [Deltaproteobacteria bacterium]